MRFANDAACVPFALLLTACASTSVTETASAVVVNDLRARGCAGRRGSAVPLRQDTALDAVAVRVAQGVPLADAVKTERYPARRSASIAVEAESHSAAFAKVLATDRYCKMVTDPAFAVLGIAADRGRTTLVLAAPFEAPVAAGDVVARALLLVNAARAQPRRCGARNFAPAAPLRADALLTKVAAGHALDMAKRGRMSHEGSDGSEPAERMTRAGYPWTLVAENVAAGQTSIDEVIATWLNSPGHCANLMNPGLREMGIAYAFDAASPDGTYWVQTLGTRRP